MRIVWNFISYILKKNLDDRFVCAEFESKILAMGNS